jgi:hypothetical protein
MTLKKNDDETVEKEKKGKIKLEANIKLNYKNNKPKIENWLAKGFRLPPEEIGRCYTENVASGMGLKPKFATKGLDIDISTEKEVEVHTTYLYHISQLEVDREKKANSSIVSDKYDDE